MACFLHEQEGDSQTQISQPTFSEEWETESSKPKKINSGGDGASDVLLIPKQKHIPVCGTFLGLNLTIINGEFFCVSNALTS